MHTMEVERDSILISAGNLLPANDTLFFVLPEVMVSAFNKTRRLLDTPGSVSMIGPGVIEREQPVTVLPLLNQLPGVFAHSGTLNTSRITIRGIGARVPYGTGKLRAYFNNIPLTNGSGISIVEHLDPGVIERIELTRGPAGSAYGAGLGGTINITARKPSHHDTGISTGFEAGSYGLFRSSITADAGTGAFNTSLVYNRLRNDGYRDNNNYRRDVFSSVMQWEPSASTRFTGLLAYSDTKGGIPSSIDSIMFFNSPRAAAANWKKTKGYEDVRIVLMGVTASQSLGRKLSIDFSLFSASHREHEMRPFDVLYEDRISGGTRMKVNYRNSAGHVFFDLMAGGELFLEQFGYRTYGNIRGEGIQGGLISDNREAIGQYNMFVQADMEYARLNVSAGLNVNMSGVTYSDLYKSNGIDRSGSYNPGAIMSPRIGASFRFHQNHAVFSGISHGFSPAALSETLTPDGFINLDIRPEKSWNYETGIRGNFMSQRAFYDVGIFQMNVQDLLVAERVGEDAWVGRNAGSSTHRGIEAEWQLYIVRPASQLVARQGWWLPAEVSLRQATTFSQFVFTDFSDFGIDFSGKFLPGIPRHSSYSSILAALNGGLYAQASHRFAGKMPMNDLNSRYTAAYQVFDLTAGYKIQLTHWVLDVYVTINNLLNRHYASMILVNAPSFGGASPRYYYPGMPRNVASGIKISYRVK